MAGAGVGLLLGSGLFCLWWACWPAPERPAKPTLRRGPRWALRALSADLSVLARPGRAPAQPARGVARLLAGCAVLAVLAATIVLGLTAVPAIALVAGAVAGSVPVSLVRGRARRARAMRRHVWPDVVDDIASAVRAGLSLPEALAAIGRRGPVQLRGPFTEFAEDYRVTGRFPECLDRLKERLADPVADRLLESIRIARDVGGSDLGRLLRTLSAFLRTEARTRAELETRQGWTINAARLAAAAPWVVLGLLATRPESVAAYRQPAGALVLVAGALVTLLAYRAMLRIARLPVDERVLR